MRPLILFLLIGVLAAYIVYQRKANYGLETATTPSGRDFQVRRLPDDCTQRLPFCMKQFVYLASSHDTLRLLEDGRHLLPWVDTQLPATSGAQGVALIALEPGLLKMGPPKYMIGLAYAKLPGRPWEYAGHLDLSEALKPLFQ